MKKGDQVYYWPNPLNDEDADVRTEGNRNGPVPAKILSMHNPRSADLQVIPEGKAKSIKVSIPLAKLPGCSGTFTLNSFSK